MGFSADPVGAELVAVVQGGDVVGPDLDVQPAIRRATQSASPAMKAGRARRGRRPPWRVLSPSAARETLK
jgi:hypothetical protein